VSGIGGKAEQTAGLSVLPNSAQSPSSVSFTHGTPAGLPSGMPGIAELIDRAMQHAPHFLHSIAHLYAVAPETARWSQARPAWLTLETGAR